MSFYLKEAVVRRRDIVDRLLKLGDSIEIISNPAFTRNSDDTRGILLSYKNLLDTHLPSSEYSKYEDVFYNWAIDHQGHRFDDLKTVVSLFEDEYIGKLRSIDKSPKIFSTSLENSLTLVDLYEMIDLIEEKQRYSTKNIKESEDAKYEAIGIYPLHVDFRKGNNLSNFILEFFEGEHTLMVVKPTTTNGSIFWSQACFVDDNREEGIEGASDYFSRLDAEGDLDTFDLSRLVSKERRHSNTVTWCTSTANPAGNMFLGYSAGTNTHLYYSLNPFKDKSDELVRFCTGLTYNVNRQTNEQEPSYVKIENRENIADSSLVNARNNYFDLENAIKEWKKYSPRILTNVNKDLMQNPQTESRASMMKQTFTGFLEKCKSLPVMQSISYKLSTNRFIQTLRNDDSILKENKDLDLLKKYFSKENLYIAQTDYSNKVKKINSLWRDFLKEKGSLSMECKTTMANSYFTKDATMTSDEVLGSLLNYVSSVYCNTLFNVFDSIIGIKVEHGVPGSFLEKYNLMHGKDYKKHPEPEGGYLDPDDEFDLEFEDERVSPIKDLQTMKKKLADIELTMNKSSDALFDFIENGLENFSKEEILDYSAADVAFTELRFNKGFKEDFGNKLDTYDNINKVPENSLNHAECIRIITSISGMNYESFKNKFLTDPSFRMSFNRDITADSNFEWSYYGKLTNPYSLVQSILDQIQRQRNFLKSKEQESRLNEAVSDIITRNLGDKKQYIEDNFSYYYKVLFENIDELFSNTAFVNHYKLQLSKHLEDIETFFAIDGNNKYSMGDIGYRIDYGLDLTQQNLKNIYIDFAAFYDNHHKENTSLMSSRLNDKDLLVDEEDLMTVNKKNITRESFLRNYDSFIKYLLSKEAVKKSLRKASKEIVSDTFEKTDVYWEVAFHYGYESFYDVISTFVKEVKQISDENLYENFKYQSMSLDYYNKKQQQFEYIEFPLLKNRLKKVFEEFFIHNNDPNDDYAEETLREYSRFLQSFELVPNETVITSHHHLPWEIIV